MGLDQMISSVGRTAGPVGGALLLAWCLDGPPAGHGDGDGGGDGWAARPFPFDYHLVWLSAAACTAAAIVFNTLLPASIDHKQDEPPHKAVSR